ncbi:SH3 domain-containing protein [Desulforhopalus singaporensis]|nr:SH3 domain-containing protein [Desulforhopalus singaporensis]
MVTVIGDNVNLRKGPGTDYPILWEYGSDFPLKVISHKDGWLQVKDFENDMGWIHKSLLKKKPVVIVKANKNGKGVINIREEPTTSSDIIGKAYYGVVFQLIEKKTGWARVKHESGLKGWINNNLLWGY